MAVVQPPPKAATSFLQTVFDLLNELPGIVSDRVQLLTLELRRARQALGRIVLLGVAAALLALTAWFALWIGLLIAAMQFEYGWAWMLALILILNVGGAWLAVARIRRLAAFLALPATVRRLTVAATPRKPRPAPPHPAAARPGPTVAPAMPPTPEKPADGHRSPP